MSFASHSQWLYCFLLFFFCSSCIYQDSEEIRKKDLMYFVGRLSSDSLGGRSAGTHYGKKAANFLVSYYKRHQFFPAFGGRYTQEFSFAAGIEVMPKQNWLSWSQKKATRASSSNQRIKILPFPFSKSGEIAGELIFVGYCIHAKEGWNDLEGLSLKGKIALCLRYAPEYDGKRNTQKEKVQPSESSNGRGHPRFAAHIPFAAKYRVLKHSGIKGILFLGKKGHLPPVIDSGAFHPLSKQGPIAAFVEPDVFFESHLGLKAKKGQLDYKKQAQIEPSSPTSYRGLSLGYVQMRTNWQRQKRTGQNVGAYLRPFHPNQHVIVVGAHYDHLGLGYFFSLGESGQIHNGADDNASGTALVMELARALRKNFRQKPKVEGTVPNVLFIHFDAEEKGLYGSNEFIESNVLQSNSILVMLNFDMVGRLRKGRGLSIQGADSADKRWKMLLETSFRQARFPSSYELHFIKGGYGPSDHRAFYEKKIPVAFFFTGGHRNYHTEKDTANTLNFDGLVTITKMNYLLIQKGLYHIQPPLVYRKAKEKARRKDFAFRLRLGIVPVYNQSSGKEGLGVREVMADAPVAKSGLKAGDLIISLGSWPIRDIHDLIDFLEEASPKKTYRLVYQRSGTTMHTTTKLISAP